MAGPGEELLGEYYGRDHLTYEEIEALHLKVATEASASRRTSYGERSSASRIKTSRAATWCAARRSPAREHDPLLPPGVVRRRLARTTGLRVEEREIYGEALDASRRLRRPAW